MKKKKSSIAAPPAENTASNSAPQPDSGSTPDSLSFLKNPWILAGTIVAAAVLAFYSALSNGFMNFDDGETIYFNKTIMNPTLGELLTTRIVGMYVPVSAVIYALSYQVDAANPAVFHGVSLAFHALASVLLFVFLNKIQPSRTLAWVTALIFAVHPTKAEPVCWVAAQTTLVFSTFYLASLISWVNYRQKDDNKWLFISVLLFALAALSKSAAVTLPLLLPVLDWYLGVWKNDKPSARNFTVLLPFFLVAFVLGAYTLTTRNESGATVQIISEQFNLFDRLLMILQTIPFYFYKLLIPIGLTINYPIEKVNGSWPVIYYLAPVLLGGILWWLYKIGRSNKLLVFSAALFIIPLSIMLPFATIGNFEMRSDRYLYISSAGFFLFLFTLLSKYIAEAQWLIPAIAIAGIYAFLGMQQTAYWQNDEKCFAHCIEYYPDNTTCLCNLAYGELLNSRFEESAAHYSRTLAKDPKSIESYNGRGQAYFFLRKIPEALSDFDNAIKGGVVTPKVFLNRGKCLVMTNRPAEAIPDLDKSIELEPRSPEAFYFRAVAHEKTGAPDKALSDYSKAIEQNPKYVEALGNRGFQYIQQKKWAEAIADYSKAIELAPTIPMLFNNRANALQLSGQPEKALADVNKAIELNPKYAIAYRMRSVILTQLGRGAEAQTDLAKSEALSAGK